MDYSLHFVNTFCIHYLSHIKINNNNEGFIASVMVCRHLTYRRVTTKHKITTKNLRLPNPLHVFLPPKPQQTL